MTNALAHLSEEVHLPQQVTEHGVDVIHLFKATTEVSDTKNTLKDQTVNYFTIWQKLL